MQNKQCNIPDHADKLLFAEDVVSCIMNNLFDVPYEANKTKPYRDIVYRAFNKTVREAVTYLCNQVVFCFVGFLRTVHETDSWEVETYLHFAKILAKLRLDKGFEARYFLCFCIEVTILANKFRINGLLHAPDIAVRLIFISLRKKDMFLGGWDSLTITASSIVKSNSTVHILTPEYDNVESSDSEIVDISSEGWDSDDNSDNADFQDADKCDDFSSDGNKITSEMHVPELEGSSLLADDGQRPSIQLNVVAGSGMAEKCGKMSRMLGLKNTFIAGKDMQSGNIQMSLASTKDNSFECVSKLKGIRQDNERFVTSKKTNIYKDYSKNCYSVNRNLDTEQSEKFLRSTKKMKTDTFYIFEETVNSADQCKCKSIASGSYQLFSPSTYSDKTLISKVTDADIETVNNMQTEGQKEFLVSVDESKNGNEDLLSKNDRKLIRE